VHTVGKMAQCERMAVRAIFIVVASLVAGCATLVPEDVTQTGEKREFMSAQATELAADCIARTADKFGASGYTGSVRLGATHDLREAIVRWQGATLPQVVLHAYLQPTGKGTRVIMRFSSAPSPALRDMVSAIQKGC